MAFPSDLQSEPATANVAGSFFNASAGLGANSTTNSTLPYRPHFREKHGSIDLVGVLIGILLPHAACTLFVLARAGSRGILLRKWFLDDSLVVAAWLCSTGVCVVYSMSAIRSHRDKHNDSSSSSGGGGGSGGSDTDRHVHDFLDAYLLRTYLGLIFYQLCLCLTKLSILALYLRMFAAVSASEAAQTPSSSTTTPRRHHLGERRLAWATVAFVIAYGVPLLWMSIMQCFPTSSPPSFFGNDVALCFSFTPLLVASASLHTATDAWLIVLVVPFVLTRMRFLPRNQRWALAAVLSLSVFVIVASLTRLQLSLHANWRPSMSMAPVTPRGPSRANTLGFFVMTVLECDIALICASAPTLRPLLARLAPRLGLGDDGGPVDRRSGVGGAGARTNRRSLFRPQRRDDDDDSEDLTSVVSYHGYPWATRTSPPARSQSCGSRGNTEKRDMVQTADEPNSDMLCAPSFAEASGSKTAVDVPKEAGTGQPDGPSMPARIVSEPGVCDRTPTDRSPPHSRDGASIGSAHESPLSGGGPSSGLLTRRPSSVFFYENSEFYDQYFSTPGSSTATPVGGPLNSAKSTEKARVPGAGIGLGIVLRPRDEEHGAGHMHRSVSQESFVLGLNDPASPTRLTRLTGVSGYSGETYTEDGTGSEPGDLKKDKNSDVGQYELSDLARKTDIHPTETSFLDDESDNEERTPR